MASRYRVVQITVVYHTEDGADYREFESRGEAWQFVSNTPDITTFDIIESYGRAPQHIWDDAWIRREKHGNSAIR